MLKMKYLAQKLYLSIFSITFCHLFLPNLILLLLSRLTSRVLKTCIFLSFKKVSVNSFLANGSYADINSIEDEGCLVKISIAAPTRLLKCIES